ncbi:MAG: DUF5312 family protein [Treponema sp.]|jgi:hypothetical protein|nr:DUF5312 family protein [Treponema sp.]
MAEDLVGKVISFFAGDSTENLSDKEVLLRQTQKNLIQNRHAKFFRAKTDEADPSLAVFFYSLYKMILPIRTFMKDTAKMTRLRQIVLEAFMDSSVPETVRRLGSESIMERAKTTLPAELTAQIKADIEKLSAGFDNTRIASANRCFNLVMSLFQLVNFDYPGLLRKFDAAFTEGPFSAEPKFSAVRAEHVAKMIAEYLAVSQAINPEGDWKNLLELLKACAGQELIPLERFTQMLITLQEVYQSKILELIVQYAAKNPIWACKPKIPDEHIGEAWLEARRASARQSIERINSSQRSSQISVLAKQIFDNDETHRLENYTADRNRILREKGLEEFAYAEGINYLKAFIEDYVEREIHELCDILLIRGQWTNNALSKEMSEAIHQLLEVPAAVAALDSVLAEEGNDGSRLKAALLRVDRDHSQARYINSIVGNINEETLELINNSAQQFIVIGKHLKTLIEDVQKKHPEMLINWRELNLASKDPLHERMVEDYKKINYLVQLMRLCTQ